MDQYRLITELEESKEEVSIASLQARMSNVDKAIECLDLVYRPNQEGYICELLMRWPWDYPEEANPSVIVQI